MVLSHRKSHASPQKEDDITTFGQLSNKKQSFNDEIECEDNLVGADRKTKRFDINLSLSSIRRDTQNSQTSKLVSSP